MEIDNTTVAHTGDAANPTTKLDGVLSMDEFMAEHAAFKAAEPAMELATKPRVKPVALGARSSKYTIALHEKYQSFGLPPPQFTFRGSSDLGWHGEVSFPGLDEELQGVKDEKRYSSKQEAKESISQRALEVLTRLETLGRVKKMETAQVGPSRYTIALHDKHQKLGIPQPFFTYSGSTASGWSAEVSFPGLDMIPPLKDDDRHLSKQLAKEASSKRALEALELAEQQGRVTVAGKVGGAAKESKGKSEPEPNYVGQLLEFQRAIRGPAPTYADYAVGSRFTCIVNIDSDDSLSESFGDLKSLHMSKKAARQDAARHAVEHFKAQGHWPEDFSDVGGIRKKQKAQLHQPELVSSTSVSADSRHTSIASSTPGTSYAQQVARLAVILSLPTPEWRYTPSLLDRDFYTVQCFFHGAGPHQGPVGEVRNVFGKKKAKEECARLTLDYLREVHAHRMAYGQKMMEDISGGEGLVEGACGRPADGEKEALKLAATRQFVKDMGGESEDEMEFEDAMEELNA